MFTWTTNVFHIYEEIVIGCFSTVISWRNESEKIPNRQTKTVNWKQIIQWPKETGQTTIYKSLHRKLKIEQHEPTNKQGEFRCFNRVSKLSLRFQFSKVFWWWISRLTEGINRKDGGVREKKGGSVGKNVR